MAGLALLGAAGGWLLASLGPPPAADVARGSEEAFASGLQPRELPPRRAPIRWTHGRSVFRFRHLPRGAARLEVRVSDHRAPVTIVAAGAIVGRIAVGETGAEIPLPPRAGSSLDVELRVEPFRAGDGRSLGTRLQRVAVVSEQRAALPLALPGLVAGASITALLGATLSGLTLLPALGCGLVSGLATVALLWPCGLARSPYALWLALGVAGASVLSAVFAWLWRRRGPAAARPAAFVGALAALLVQGLVASSPLLVASDVVFHANKLGVVAAGELFPTSVTQHSPPFRIPYGVSFYALLAPLARAGVDQVALVRWGAAASGVLASLALFALALPLGARVAALAVVLLQLLPGVVDIYSYGNLSNVFAQAVSVGFLAWWTGRAAGGALVGGLLLATAGLGHLSGLIVLGALLPALVFVRRAGLRQDRARLLALAAGLALLALYYAQFWPLVSEQLPRLAGRGEGGSPGLASALLKQMRDVAGQWGLPALVLAWIGRPRPRERSLDRDLAACWLAGGALAAVAVVSPLEVRYVYALTPVVAIAAAGGAVRLTGRGGGLLALASLLLCGQLWLAVTGIAEALLQRYR